MTITETRPEPTVVDGEIVPGSIRYESNPHRFNLIASAVILLGTGAAFLTNLHGDPTSKAVNVVVFLAAICLYVFFLIRTYAWAR